MDYSGDFALGEEQVWLNAAHQGALPGVAARAAAEAVAWKQRPWRMTAERFDGVPQRLRGLLARWIGADPADVFLSNGASHGLHLLANGLPLERGDEVLLMQGDFPSNTLPWIGLRERGVEVRLLRPRAHVLQPDEIEQALSPRTRAVCLSWVHSFSGWRLDIESIGERCRAAGARLIVNATQGLGPRGFDVTRTPVDALVCAGWKWLCGPYGTGFGWFSRELRESLELNQRYWLSLQTAEDLATEATQDVDPPPEARRYDVFGTANFFNFHPWAAALDYLISIGAAEIGRHDDVLVDRLVSGLDPAEFELLSPSRGPERSTLVFLSHRRPERNRELFERCRSAEVFIALRRGRLRAAPHLYNTPAQIDRLLGLLSEAR